MIDVGGAQHVAARARSPRRARAPPGPGPGTAAATARGCGRPSSAPSARTSSLNSSRSGSTSLSFIRSGRPPTLWCVLMVADGPLNDTDSITSGYSVPCARNSRVADLLGLLLEDRDELAADDLALLLGVGDAGAACRGSARSASTTRRSALKASRNSASTCARLARAQQARCRRRCRSGGRRSPCSTSAAATDESTPPDSPQIDAPVVADLARAPPRPPRRRSRPSSSSARSRRCGTGSSPRISPPRGVCATSGWNCTP